MKRLFRPLMIVAVSGVVGTMASPVVAVDIDELVWLQLNTSLEELNLTGGPFPIPLAADPANLLGDSIEGYGFVDSVVTVTLSSQRVVPPGPVTQGEAIAYLQGFPGKAAPGGQGDPPPIDPAELDGGYFFVDSFFDGFFDITVTDVDSRPGRDFAGQPDGVTMGLYNNGPSRMLSNYMAIFDKDAPNFGLFPPPETDPYYIENSQIEIPLAGDINGNGENDKVKFTLVTIPLGDENRTFIELPDGTTIDMCDSGALLEGVIVDESTDPPFTIGATLPNGLPDPSVFGGPATATSQLANPVLPEPSTFILLGTGLGLLLVSGYRGRKR